MAGRDVYQIGQPTITKPAAANFVAEELFPGRGRRTAYQRIHSRITEAQRKGELPQGQSISADVFFGWAVEQKGWEALRSVPGLPMPISILVKGTSATAQVGSDVSGFLIPADCEELKRHYIAAMHKLEIAEREIIVLKKQLADIQAAKKARSMKMSEAGKQGGRGNAK